MYMRGARTKPPPSFRVNSKVIEESGSKTFIDQLFNTAEPEGWPQFYPNDATAGSSSPEESIELYEDYPNDLPSRMRSPMSNSDALRPLDLSKRNIAKAPHGIQHEIYIQWPGAESGIPSTIWHITTRNFFAVLYDARALVGTTLLETFSPLFERVRMYPDYLDPNISKVSWITDYIVRHKFDDVRNNPSYAASLLAFSETPGVNWREGYIEAFVHCAGMVNMGLQTTPEWRNITPHRWKSAFTALKNSCSPSTSTICGPQPALLLPLPAAASIAYANGSASITKTLLCIGRPRTSIPG